MSLLILGAGYVGARLAARHSDAIATRRRPEPGSQRFELADEPTWAELPRTDSVVWTFPAVPVESALHFYEQRLAGVSNLIVLGSTSAYVNGEPDAWIDESAPLDLTQERVAGEEALRRRGATVLCLAGIWGPGRDPVKWLLDGRIRNGRKYVNLAHVDDILAAIEAVLRAPRPGERINVCDGEPSRWREHGERLIATGRLPEGFRLPEAPPGPDSKRVRNDRLRELLPWHPFVKLT